jgi:uncharacterized protein
VGIQWGGKIPLRDGVLLNATVYLPEQQHAPRPCVVTLTPYIADTYHERGMYFAAHGWLFASVDVRGRGSSEGTFRPFIQEAQDGYDVVEWLAAQKYCDGRVAMWGGSYAGFAQWATAKECPPHLRTIVPTAGASAGIDFPMRNNIRSPYLIQWIALTRGRSSQARAFADQALWSRLFRAWYESGRAFRDLDTLTGAPSALFQEWLSHPEPDAYWDAYNPTPGQLARLNIPVLTITGSYDDDQPGALEHYRQHQLHGSAEACAKHYLVIGPWDHAGTRTPRAQVGGLEFGAASVIDISRLHLEWYAWVLGEGPRPAFLEKRVAYYVTGAECWRYADSLEEVTVSAQCLYLDSAGAAADDILSAGLLGPTPGGGPPDQYLYGPRDPGDAVLDAVERCNGGSLTDQSVLLTLRGKCLVYHSAPFEADTEISGFFELSAWIAIDCPDTDFYVSVYEIDTQGTAIRLSMDAMRARYREGLRVPKLVETREPLLYEFSRFTFVSRRVRRGQRLRLVIAPIGRVIETAFVEKNNNAGGVVCEETAAEARAVTVRVFHDLGRRSVLRIPVGRG